MPLTLATLLLFFALTPGAVFLLGIRANPAAVSAKDVFDSPIQEVISLLSISLILLFFAFLGAIFFMPDFVDLWLFGISSLHVNTPLTSQTLLEILVPAGTFFLSIYMVSYVLGRFFPSIKFGFGSDKKIHSSTLRKFLYHIHNDEMLFAWVLTKTSYDNKHLMYLGLVRTVKLDQDKIAQITLNFPSKTYIDFDTQLTLVHENSNPTLPRDLTNLEASIENILYIPHDNISNIYFEKFSTNPLRNRPLIAKLSEIFVHHRY